MTHQKVLKTGIIASILLVAAILTTTTTTATNVQASNNNDNDNPCADKEVVEELLCGVGNAAKGYNQGERDGTNAALNGQSNECPQSNSLSGYCLGFGSGWNKVTYAQETLNKANGNNNNDDDNGNNNNNDDDNNGNREDDGEFVPEKRTIDQTPKRVIGDSN